MLRGLIFLVSLGTRALRTICRRRANLVMEKPRPAAASDGAQEGAAASTPRRHRPRILGRAPKFVAGVGEPLGHRQRRHSRAVESGSVPTILDSDLAQTLSRPTSD